MKGWDSDLEEEEGEEGAEKETSNGKEKNGGGETRDTQGHIQKVQKLIYAAKVCDKTRHEQTAFDVELVNENSAILHTC